MPAVNLSTSINALKQSSQRRDTLIQASECIMRVLESATPRMTADYFNSLFQLGHYDSSLFQDFMCPPTEAKAFAQQCFTNIMKALEDEEKQIIKVAAQITTLVHKTKDKTE